MGVLGTFCSKYILLVMVLNLGVCSRFLTKDFVDMDVLICGLNCVFGIVDRC